MVPKSNLESVVVSTGFSFVIDVADIFGVEVVFDVVEVVVDVDVAVEVVVDFDVDEVVEVVVDELESGTDRCSAASASVVVGIVVVVGSSSEQTEFATAFHLQASSSNHEKKSLKTSLIVAITNFKSRIYLYLLQSQTYFVFPQSSIHSRLGSVSLSFNSQINRGPNIVVSHAS